MRSLIVFGRSYNFLNFELNILYKKFNEIHFVDTFEAIENFIEKRGRFIVLLNIDRNLPNKTIDNLIELKKKGVSYITIQSFMERYLHKCYIPSDYGDIGFLENIKPFNTLRKFIKTILDYIISIALLIIASPVMIYSIYRIKKESNGAIIYSQERIGLNGKPFICYKFRSMHENSPHDPYTREDDNRIFHWGKIMRKTRIDELPQIWNVLKGDMSMIGPRAEWNILVEKYEKKIPYYHGRHLVKPGITGWAQVNYPYGVNSFDAKQKLMYDFYYIKNWSLGLEIKIIWRTFLIIIIRKGL